MHRHVYSVNPNCLAWSELKYKEQFVIQISIRANQIRRSQRIAVLAGLLLVGVSVVAWKTPAVVLASNSTATFFVSAPGVEGPDPIAGMDIETFDSLSAGSKGVGSALAIGTVSANSLTVHNCSGATCWAGASTSSNTPAPSIFSLPASTPNPNYPDTNKTPFAYPSSQVTVTLIRPVNYFGFYWAAGSGSNTVKLFDGNTLVASFSTADLNTLLPTSRAGGGGTVSVNGGGTYNVDNYRGGHKSAWDSWYTASGVNCSLSSPNTWSAACWNPQQFAYVHAVVPQGVTFDKVQLISSDFEFDNLAIANYAGTFDPTGLVGIPLSNASITPTLTPAVTTTTATSTTTSSSTTTSTSTSTSSTTTTVPSTSTTVQESVGGRIKAQTGLPETGNSSKGFLVVAIALLGIGRVISVRRRVRV